MLIAGEKQISTGLFWKIRELAATYLTTCVTVFLTGPGSISLDQRVCESAHSANS